MYPLPSEPGKLFKMHTQWCSIILKYFCGSQHFRGIRVTTSKYYFTEGSNVYLRNEVISLLWDIFWSSVVCHKIWHCGIDCLKPRAQFWLWLCLTCTHMHIHTCTCTDTCVCAHTFKNMSSCVSFCQNTLSDSTVVTIVMPILYESHIHSEDNS